MKSAVMTCSIIYVTAEGWSRSPECSASMRSEVLTCSVIWQVIWAGGGQDCFMSSVITRKVHNNVWSEPSWHRTCRSWSQLSCHKVLHDGSHYRAPDTTLHDMSWHPTWWHGDGDSSFIHDDNFHSGSSWHGYKAPHLISLYPITAGLCVFLAWSLKSPL